MLMNTKFEILVRFQSCFTQPDELLKILKISPDGFLLAMGSHGKSTKLEVVEIDEYENAIRKYMLVNINLVGSTIAIDWVKDIENHPYLILNTSNEELIVADVRNQQMVPVSKINCLELYTYTTIYNHFSRGLHIEVGNSSDVSAVCTRENLNFLVAGTKNGDIFLAKNPCVDVSSRLFSRHAHSGPVFKIEISSDGNFFISVSQDSIFMWRVEKLDKENLEFEEFEAEIEEFNNMEKDEDDSSFSGEEESDDSENEKRVKNRRRQRMIKLTEGDEIEYDNPTLYIKERKDFEFGDSFKIEYSKPINRTKEITYMRNKEQISLFSSKERSSAPKMLINAIYIFGIDTTESYKNLIRFEALDLIASFSKGYAYTLETRRFEQNIYFGHKTFVSAICKHPFSNEVITVDQKKNLVLWNVSSLIEISRIQNKTPEKIEVPLFVIINSEGRLVALLSKSQIGLVIEIYNINKRILIDKTILVNQDVKYMAFRYDNEFITVGENHFKVWTLKGNILYGKKGKFGGNCKDLFCVEIVKNDVVVGTGKGDLQIWRDDVCSFILQKLHNKAILDITSNSSYVITCGIDGFINVLDHGFQKVNAIDLNQSEFGRYVDIEPKRVVVDEDENNIYAVTRSGELLKFENEALKLISSHFNRIKNKISRITCISMFKRSLSFLTVSEDGCLKKWSIDSPSDTETLYLDIGEDGEEMDEEGMEETKNPARLLHYSIDTTPSENYAAIGSLDGSIRIIDIHRFAQIKYLSVERNCITLLKFSPSGNYILIGTADGYIHLRNTFDFDLVKKTRRRVSKFAIVACDWTFGDKTIQIEDSERVKLMFCFDKGMLFQVTSETNIRESELKWSSQDCYSAWNLSGLLKLKKDMNCSPLRLIRRCTPENDDSIHIGDLVACSREDGVIEIYKFPCVSVNMKSFSFKAHNGTISDFAWSYCNQFMVTIGEEDNSVIVWKVDRIF